jgi:carbonic anhydrase
MNHFFTSPRRHASVQRFAQGLLALSALALAMAPTWANDATLANPVHTTHAPVKPEAARPTAPAAASAAAGAEKVEAPVIDLRRTVKQQLTEALERSSESTGIRKKAGVTLSTAAGKGAADAHAPAEVPASRSHAIPAEAKSRTAAHRPAKAASGHGAAAAHAPAAAHGAHAAPHWSYEGETGPQAWGQLEPGFNVCAIGKRQSPIHIEESTALKGPAEPLQISYLASKGSVVNNGHTIQVDLDGDNTLTVRGSTYKLLQFHFHHPAEERVNYKGFAMVAHLVHKNAEGQLAVLAVLFDPGESSPLIQKVWTHMPLDVNDRVRLPEGLIDLNEALPKDRRYYQFMGSLTTPPCTEGVLWLVLKEPMTLSREQLKLFTQLFPNNARPVQPSNSRVVREAQ